MTKNQVHKLQAKLGHFLFERAIRSLRKGYDFKETKMESGQLQSILKKKYNIPDEKVYCADEMYRIPDHETLLQVIEDDQLDLTKYLSDYFDCNNFGDSFSSKMAYIYGFNSIGTANYLTLMDEEGKVTGYHRANLVVSTDKKGEIRAYLYEPMNDQIDEVQDYNTPLFQSGRYNKFNYFELN